jgi:hypothetical protein
MSSLKLKIQIEEFRNKTLSKHNYLKFEPNDFDLFLDQIYLILNKFLRYIFSNKLTKKINLNLIKMFNKLIQSLTDKISDSYEYKFKKIENIMDQQKKIFKDNIAENQELKKEVFNLHKKLDNYLDLNKLKNSSDNELNSSENLGHNSLGRVDFYQEENLRIGSELVETKKKFDILKNEIEKYEKQRSDLITKINSVNDVLTDSNVLTDVFDNDVTKKINIIDHKNIKVKKDIDLDSEVKNIFSNKN